MINIHQRLIDAFATLPAIVQGTEEFKPNYQWGDHHHLNLLIKKFNNDNKTPYPLIYNVSNYSDQSSNKNNANCRLSLVLATRNTRTDYDNSERWASSYKNILFPLAMNIEQCFRRSQIFVWDGDFRLFEFPNYGEDGENVTTDIWDALRFDTDITINDFCLNKFTYK
jgi:hypothetical protein